MASDAARSKRLKNGDVIVSFQAGGIEEIVSWVLSWGAHAKVIAPPGTIECGLWSTCKNTKEVAHHRLDNLTRGLRIGYMVMRVQTEVIFSVTT